MRSHLVGAICQSNKLRKIQTQNTLINFSNSNIVAIEFWVGCRFVLTIPNLISTDFRFSKMQVLFGKCFAPPPPPWRGFHTFVSEDGTLTCVYDVFNADVGGISNSSRG